MMEPLISIKIHGAHRVFAPADKIEGEFQIDNISVDQILAVEQSIMWYTEGKGEEDLGIHDFKRFTATAQFSQPLNELRTFQSILPCSPLSYEGFLIKLRWSVRIRVFLARGKEVVEEQPFQLGNIPSYRETQEYLQQNSTIAEEQESETEM